MSTLSRAILGGDLAPAFGATLRPAIFDRDGAALDPPEFCRRCTKAAVHGCHTAGVVVPMNPIVRSFVLCCARTGMAKLPRRREA